MYHKLVYRKHCENCIHDILILVLKSEKERGKHRSSLLTVYYLASNEIRHRYGV